MNLMAMEQETEKKKQEAVKAALEYVHKKYLASKQPIFIGVGSGTTASIAVPYLSKYENIAAIPTSRRTEALLADLGVETREAEEVRQIEFDLDGADEVEASLALIKGGGGSHTREKVVAKKSRELVIVVDESKLVDYLGQSFPVPVEVKRNFAQDTREELEGIGPGTIRKVNGQEFETDLGNLIIDIQLKKTYKGVELENLERNINKIKGVVDNGIFALRKADIVFVGTKEGVSVME